MVTGVGDMTLWFDNTGLKYGAVFAVTIIVYVIIGEETPH